MEVQIKSGNSGEVAKVDIHKRVHVDAITFGRSEQEVEIGNGYNINTGTVNLTTANKSGILYFKNQEDFDIVITNMFYILGNSNSNGDTNKKVQLILPTDKTLQDATKLSLRSSKPICFYFYEFLNLEL